MAFDLWQPLIVCDPVHPNTSGPGNSQLPPCDYGAFIHLIRNAISDLGVVATFVTLFVCIYIGFQLVTSQGNAGAMKDARGRAVKILWGYFFILAAWVIVYAVASVL